MMQLAAKIAAATLLGLALTLAGAAGPATAQSTQQVAPPAKKKIVKRPQRGGGRQIACTAFGCRAIPPNCHPQTGYRWDGMPSGFDIVVCR